MQVAEGRGELVCPGLQILAAGEGFDIDQRGKKLFARRGQPGEGLDRAGRKVREDLSVELGEGVGKVRFL